MTKTEKPYQKLPPNSDSGSEHHEPLPTPLSKALLLFLNLFLVLLAYYHVKPARSSLFLEYSSSDILWQVWILSALALFVLMPFYQVLLRKFGRYYLTQAACILFSATMVLFWWIMQNLGEERTPGAQASAIIFYILIDIFSVMLVEQFWSLSDSVFKTRNAKKWFGLIAAGGLVGSTAGGWASRGWLEYTSIETNELLLVAAVIILVVSAITFYLARHSFYDKNPLQLPKRSQIASWKILRENNYLLLIAVILLLAQLAQPIVDYQFMSAVESEIAGENQKERRTAFFGVFFGTLSFFALLVNLIVTPIIHRYVGVVAGLLVQPIVLGISSVFFMFLPSLNMAIITKSADRGLSWSINRASRELLYVPIAPNTIYQAKGWIDMFGYRAFKVFGAGIVALCTIGLPDPFTAGQMAILVVAICMVRVMMMVMVGKRYKEILQITRRRHKKSSKPVDYPDKVSE